MFLLVIIIITYDVHIICQEGRVSAAALCLHVCGCHIRVFSTAVDFCHESIHVQFSLFLTRFYRNT